MLTLHSVGTEQSEGPTDTVSFSTDSETIKPYWPRNMPSLSIGRLHLSLNGCQVSCFILILFQIYFLLANCVVSDQTPRSATSYLGLLCFPMSLLSDARYIWFNTVRFYCISGNHRHVVHRGISHPASNRLHLLLFLQCEKEKGLRIRT